MHADSLRFRDLVQGEVCFKMTFEESKGVQLAAHKCLRNKQLC